MDGPDVVYNPCILGKSVPHILVICGHGMWRESSLASIAGSPLHMYECPVCLRVVHVSNGRRFVGTGTINRSLGAFLSCRVQDHCLQKAMRVEAVVSQSASKAKLATISAT